MYFPGSYIIVILPAPKPPLTASSPNRKLSNLVVLSGQQTSAHCSNGQQNTQYEASYATNQSQAFGQAK